MSFDWPLALAALAALPLLVALYLDRDRRRIASQAEFGNPDLLPNVVDREPGRLRYLPPLILLVALVVMIVGVARPHATVSVPREEATVILAHRRLALDEGDGRRADPARRCPRRSEDVPGRGAREVPRRRRLVRDPGRRRRRADPGSGARGRRARHARARRGHGDRRRRRALGSSVGQPEGENAQAPPRAIVLISDGARDGGRIDPPRRRSRPSERGVPVYTVLVGTPDGVVEEELTGRLQADHPRAPEPRDPRAGRPGRRAASSSRRPTPSGCATCTRSSARGSARASEDREITDVFAAGAAAFLLVGGHARPRSSSGGFREGRSRRCSALTLVGRRSSPPLPAGAANECDGLHGLRAGCRARGSSCRPRRRGRAARRVPAHVPARPRRRRSRRAAQRPRHRRLASSGRSAARSTRASRRRARPSSSATYVGSPTGAPTFRPFVGCMPAAGGGSRVPTSVAAFRPGQPVTRRVQDRARSARDDDRRPGCAAGERLVGASHAFGFSHAHPPSASLVSSVSGSQQSSGGSVVVRVRGDAELGGVRALVQVHALCARVAMSFQSPWLLLGLLVLAARGRPLALAERRRVRYAVRFTNLDVLATVVSGRSWPRFVPPALLVRSGSRPSRRPRAPPGRAHAPERSAPP